jgi:hypothetical protein
MGPRRICSTEPSPISFEVRDSVRPGSMSWRNSNMALKRGRCFGFQLGANPRALVTTMPKPIRLLKQIIADPRTVVTRGGTMNNAANEIGRNLIAARNRLKCAPGREGVWIEWLKQEFEWSHNPTPEPARAPKSSTLLQGYVSRRICARTAAFLPRLTSQEASR